MIVYHCFKCDRTTRQSEDEFLRTVPNSQPHCVTCGKRIVALVQPDYPEEDEVPLGFPELLDCKPFHHPDTLKECA